MSSGRISKVEMLSRVLRLKDRLSSGKWMQDASEERRRGADETLNIMLEILSEYHY